MSRLFLEISVGEQIRVGDAVLTLQRKLGPKSRFSIEAASSVKVELIKPESMSQKANILDYERKSATDTTKVITHGENDSRA